MIIFNPVNEMQRAFNELCKMGGGRHGGPPRTKVQELMHFYGAKLNKVGEREILESLASYPELNPWRICFAVGLVWGHLAIFNLEFVGAAARLLEDWNSEDLNIARQHHYERGPEPIEQSLAGGHALFSKARLPDKLPESLHQYSKIQQHWLRLIAVPERPKYIGVWNATAMFMVALFSNLQLAAELKTPEVVLPTGGPIHAGLSIVRSAHLLSHPPASSALNDGDFEIGAVFEDNGLFAELVRGYGGWSTLDVHSGLYLLGTRLQGTDKWFE